MALNQFTQQFIANLPMFNQQNLKEFYDTLLRTLPKDRINFISNSIDKQKHVLPTQNWFYGKDDIKSRGYRTRGNECFKNQNLIEALVSGESMR